MISGKKSMENVQFLFETIPTVFFNFKIETAGHDWKF